MSDINIDQTFKDEVYQVALLCDAAEVHHGCVKILLDGGVKPVAQVSMMRDKSLLWDR
jgi:hypothetical protein